MEIVRLAGLKVGQAFLYQRHWMTVADVNDKPRRPQDAGDAMMRDVFGDIFSQPRPGSIICNDLTQRSRVTLLDHAYVERCE